MKNFDFLIFQESCLEFERLVSSQCESLIQLIQERREFLLDTIRMDKESKIRILKVNFDKSFILEFPFEFSFIQF